IASKAGTSASSASRASTCCCSTWRSTASSARRREVPYTDVGMTKAVRPEDFLELVRRAKRGRLKLYLGFAAGVGKTYRMLEEAHALRERGVDCVIAYVETHGRAEVGELVDGLEVIPRKRIDYRGVFVEEMDLDAALARRPDVAIVD